MMLRQYKIVYTDPGKLLVQPKVVATFIKTEDIETMNSRLTHPTQCTMQQYRHSLMSSFAGGDSMGDGDFSCWKPMAEVEEGNK